MKLVSKICIGVGAGVLGVALIGAGTVYGIWHNEINSMVSIKKVIEAHPDNYAGNVYMMEMDGGFYFDDFLEQGGVSNDGDLIDFIVGNITKGLFEVSLNQPEIEVGCSSFTAINGENNHRLFGRNYDFAETFFDIKNQSREWTACDHLLGRPSIPFFRQRDQQSARSSDRHRGGLRPIRWHQ